NGMVSDTFEAGSLTVTGILDVSGSITPKGPITFLRHNSGWVPQGSSDEHVVDVLSDPDELWQCFLSGIRMGSPDDDIRHTNCKVEYTANAWKLIVTTTFNWQT